MKSIRNIFATRMTYSVMMTAMSAHINGKGGRLKMVRKGTKPDLSATSRTLQTLNGPLQDRLDALTKHIHSLRFDVFSLEFVFPENLKQELQRLVCLQILDKPVETSCQHYF